jgi:protease I
MENKLEKIKVAILATNGFEQVELTEPRKFLDEHGATTHIVAPEEGSIKAWDETDWGDSFDVDVQVADAKADDYDALLLPGGVLNPDNLRMDKKAVQFVKSFFEAGKPVASICHGPQMLIEAGVLKGRKATSYPSLSTDLKNAGANWVNQEVVIDNGLITSRNPDDIPAFNKAMLKEFSKVPVS